MKSPNRSQKRVCIISLTKVTQEPRVLRQIRTFREKGWAISVIGYPSGASAPPDWEFFDASVPQTTFQAGGGDQTVHRSAIDKAAPEMKRTPVQAIVFGVLDMLRKVKRTLRGAQVWAFLRIHDLSRAPRSNTLIRALARKLSTMTSRRAHNHYWSYPKFRIVRDTILGKVSQCDLVIGHDYFTYPLAAMLAKKHNARLAVDCHEYAREQYNYDDHPDPRQRYEWFFIRRPLSDALQGEYFHKASAVSTVCDGIADLLRQDYDLAAHPTVIRSTPFYEELPFRPCGARIDVLYHGIISSSRNLDVGIRSVPLWRPEFRFVIRGPAEPAYEDELRALIAKLGLQDRVVIEPPVPFAELVKAANQADVGYFAFENFSKQRQFTAPNKFFEYIMAGLALIVMNTPELAKVVNQYHNGLLVERFDENSIAAAVNSLTPEKIDEMKKHSLAAAKALCWEHESLKLVDAYRIAN